jgi:hypothetical protein
MDVLSTDNSFSFAGLEWPFGLYSKVVMARKPQRADVMVLLQKAKQIHDMAISQKARLIELELANLRLQQENDSMRHLINSVEGTDGKS